MRKIIGLLLLVLLPTLTSAATVTIKGARLWAAPDSTRLVFDISGPVQHALFTLSKPDRLVIDISNAKLATRLDGADFSKGVIKDIRSAPRGAGLRVVLDLKSAVRPKSFLLKPNSTYGNRLVIDLDQPEHHSTTVSKRTQRPQPVKARDVVIAIDPGHGGEDPGATGPHGTHEKTVVLAIARRLEALVRKTPGMRPVMTRDGDYYVPLRKRIDIARKDKADLFISIHADAYRDRSARGASVYALSKHGASSEAARWLAERENASDFVGGVSLDDKDDLLASVLLDLSQTGTIEASLELGKDVLSHLRQIGPLHKSRVNQAGFVVLKSPDIPSVLVETAFISNPSEERKLRSSRQQEKLAQSIMAGIRGYMQHNAPPGTVLAQHSGARRHVIVRGDTLSDLARRYDVSLDKLRMANGLDNDTLHVGEVLKIPSGSGDG